MSLQTWISAQAARSTDFMLRAISATDLFTYRRSFDQRVQPIAGSVLASPVPGHYDPEPDYFFHWFRDAAIAIDALRIAHLEGHAGESALPRFGEFVRFSHALLSLDGGKILRGHDPRAGVEPDFRKFLRSEAELSALTGPSLLADARLNADGTPDISRWSRPQADGPAFTALVLARWLREVPQLTPAVQELAGEVIRAYLEFTLEWIDRASFDIWEEESGEPYYTRLLQAQACLEAASWLPGRQADLRRAADRALERLDAFWDPSRGFYRSRRGVTNGAPAKELDMSVTLAQLHAGRRTGAHSILDPRAQATLHALKEFFAGAYRINRDPATGRSPAMGRYPGDQYFSGGAYYFATLGAAEFHYSICTALAEAGSTPVSPETGTDELSSRCDTAEAALHHGDGFMETVRAHTPEDGSLSEQFDQTDGAQTSAHHLTWSYAAFITAAAGRSRARRHLKLLRSRIAV